MRVWPEGPGLRGLVEHVRSGQAQPFHGDVELLAFLTELRDEPREQCQEPAEQRADSERVPPGS